MTAVTAPAGGGGGDDEPEYEDELTFADRAVAVVMFVVVTASMILAVAQAFAFVLGTLADKYGPVHTRWRHVVPAYNAGVRFGSWMGERDDVVVYDVEGTCGDCGGTITLQVRPEELRAEGYHVDALERPLREHWKECK